MSSQILNEETIYKGKVFSLVKARFRLLNGSEHTYDLVKHHGAVTILPVDQEGRIWFVRQYRVGADQDLLELPAGVLEPDESPESTALRELQEEIGMSARRLQKLGEFYMVPGYSTEKMIAYLATELYESALPADEGEYLEKSAVPVAEAYRMVGDGLMQDGKTLASLLLARAHLQKFGV